MERTGFRENHKKNLGKQKGGTKLKKRIGEVKRQEHDVLVNRREL